MARSEEQERRPSPRRRWLEDFPIGWERDHYIMRRELAKFMALGSALLAGASVVIAVAGQLLRPRGAEPAIRVATAASIPPGGSLLFRYPSDDDPCIVIRGKDGSLRAYSQICTHLSCAVVHDPAQDCLLCPCHHGSFSATEGRPIAGPPTRRLPRVKLEERGGEVYAVGVEI